MLLCYESNLIQRLSFVPEKLEGHNDNSTCRFSNKLQEYGNNCKYIFTTLKCYAGAPGAHSISIGKFCPVLYQCLPNKFTIHHIVF